MKNAWRTTTILGGIILALGTFGCSARPDEQMQNAQKAMDQATEQQASEFAPTEWQGAQQAWNDAQALITSGKYGEATSMLLRAKSRFEKARDIARGKREPLIKEIQGIQKTIEIRYQGVKGSLASAKLSSKIKSDLQESCKEIDQAIEKLNAQMGQKEYTQAKYTAQTTLRQVYEAEKQMEGSGKRK